MKNKLIYLTLAIVLVISPLLVRADGAVIRALPDSDWAWVDENSQQAFINYEEGIEKLIIAVDIEEGNSDIVWIIPVPSEPQKVDIDITSELPIFLGDNVISKAKLKFYENLKTSYSASLFSQVWTFPFGIFFFLGGARGGPDSEIVPGDSVFVEAHIEKSGMIAEVITAKDGQAIYNYFSQKGFNIEQGSIAELDYYIEKDYSFVVSWIAPGVLNEERKGERGIFISFPTSKIYYPLILTSVYGELEIPIIIRVLDYVKPEIFPEIRPYSKVEYFTEKTEEHRGRNQARCISSLFMVRTNIEIYYFNHNGYPSSFWALQNDDEIKKLLKNISRDCYFLPSYSSKNKDDYALTLMLWDGLFMIDSSGFYGFIDIKRFDERELASSELEKFYGTKNPWKGEAEYTKITINAPSKLFNNDLWMEKGKPLKISFALWSINNSLVVVVILYLLIVGIASFIAGGLAGLLCFRKFKKYALLGLSNIFTLVALIFNFNHIKKKEGEDVRYSKFSFIFSFSIIFISLLILAPLISVLWGEKVDLWFLPAIVFVGINITGGVLLLIEFILNKIGIKNEVIKSILTIILFIIFWIGVGYFVLKFI